MLNIPVSVYEEVADRLREALGMKDYFSGSIEAHDDDYDYRLTATLIVYRERERAEDEAVAPIYDVVPVWWEFATVLPDGDEVLNDFAFLPLKKALLELQ